MLWKAKKEDEPAWQTAIGEGRPGWHLECSAMSMDLLGETFDIHTGAVDLIFPHHENEIAQSEGATGKPFVPFWVHGEHLNVDQQKMSKSLGNIYTLAEIEELGYDPLALRYALISVPYRTKLNFTTQSLDDAKNALARIESFLLRLDDVARSGPKDAAHADDEGDALIGRSSASSRKRWTTTSTPPAPSARSSRSSATPTPPSTPAASPPATPRACAPRCMKIDPVLDIFPEREQASTPRSSA